MAQKVYVGVDNIARNVKNIYVGVDGVARKVIKGYVGVDGIARQFWGASSVSTDSWDYWVSLSSQLPEIGGGYKSNHKIAYYAAFHDGNEDSALLVSPDADAVYYNGFSYNSSFVDNNGIRWYYNGRSSAPYYDNDCLLSDTIYIGLTGIRQAAEDLVDKIYGVPFQNNYIQGNIYTLSVTNLRKTIRKIYGIALYRHVSMYNTDTGYILFSNNANQIIDEIIRRITLKGDENGFIQCTINVTPNDGILISVVHGTVNWGGSDFSSKSDLTAIRSSSNSGYNSWFFNDSNGDGGIIPDWEEEVDIDKYGSITYTTYDGWDVQLWMNYMAGVNIESESGVTKYSITNFGINL